MVEISRPWGGTVTGDAGPYTDDQWEAVWRSISRGAVIPTNLGGVLRDELNELVVTGATSPLSTDSGRAVAHGTWYENSAAVSVAVATPAGATRIDRIVLRKDWTLQTVRIFRIAGVEGGGAPALVQTDGVTWDTPLFQASVTTGGAITLTDERQFIPDGLVLEGSNLVEAGTTSVAAVDLLSVTGLVIPADKPILVIASIRKTTGAAAQGSVGLKLNAIEVLVPFAWGSSANEEANGIVKAWIGPREANYLRGGWMEIDGVRGGANSFTAKNPFITADMPAVLITDVVIRALVSNALITTYCDSLRVYSLPV